MGNLDNALMSVASNANGPSLVHTDLDCDRLAEVCDESCQEEALGALAGMLGFVVCPPRANSTYDAQLDTFQDCTL